MEREKLIALVQGAQNGDSAAMEALFAAFYNDVYYFARKTVKDADIACDITQETFLEIIRTVGNLKEPAAFVTWMKQITYHQCTRHFKKKKDILADEDEDGNTLFDTLADEREGSIPAEVCEQEEFRQTILGIIDALSEAQRAAVMLYYFDELPVSEIAQIQGVSEGTVKSRLNYARKAIKKSVEDYEKKYDVKLHSFAIAPLLLLLLGKETMPPAQLAEISATVATAAGAGTASASGAASVGGKLATAIGKKIAVKIITGALIAAVGGTAIVGGLSRLGGWDIAGDEPIPMHEMRDETGDALCDRCSMTACFYRHTDAPPHNTEEDPCLCAGCGEATHEFQQGGDNCSICSGCGISDFAFSPENPTCKYCGGYPCDHFEKLHYDNDDNNICDYCGIGIG